MIVMEDLVDMAIVMAIDMVIDMEIDMETDMKVEAMLIEMGMFLQMLYFFSYLCTIGGL